MNSSSDPTQPAENFFGSASKASRTGTFMTNAGGAQVTFTLFGVNVPPGPEGGLAVRTGTTSVTAWNYVSSSPTNNPTEGYDLWLDVVWRGKTNRISNWSPEPQPLP